MANCELSSHLVGRGFELVRLDVLNDHLALLLQLILRLINSSTLVRSHMATSFASSYIFAQTPEHGIGDYFATYNVDHGTLGFRVVVMDNGDGIENK